MNCPGKKSHINAGMPPRLCYGSCARYEYAAHLTGGDWMKPKVSEGKCENHVQRVGDKPANCSPSDAG